MTLKTLLVAFSTERPVEEGSKEMKRVRFKSGSVIDLTDKELKGLEALEKSTGKLHMRDPKSEGGEAVASEPEVVVVPDYAGQDVAIDAKTVDQLKAYLVFYQTEPKGNKDDLVKQAREVEAGQAANKAAGDNEGKPAADRDAGL